MASIGTFAFVMVVLVVLCKPISSQFKIIESPAVTNFGVWGTMEYCPGGSFAYQFRTKYENWAHFNDDTSLNAIRLRCQDTQTKLTTATISSTEGPWGKWGNSFFPQVPEDCLYLVGFQLKSEPYQGSGDDTAANQIRFKCATGKWVRSDDGEGGVFSHPQYCDKGQAICGIQTQVEPSQGGGDDTALNNVRFACCDCPLCPYPWEPPTTDYWAT